MEKIGFQGFLDRASGLDLMGLTRKGVPLSIITWSDTIDSDYNVNQFIPSGKATYLLAVGVSRLGLVVMCSAGKRKDAGSIPRFGSTFSSKIVIYGHCLVSLPCTINETLKWLTSLPHRTAEIILVVDSA